ncbi:hypothetical protein A2U01_0096939, partial [Trifolium medium]|nr:hypothetical protein [Trifolium medium]
EEAGGGRGAELGGAGAIVPAVRFRGIYYCYLD